MQNRLRIWPVALLAAAAVSSAGNPAWAQPNGRLVVAGRQRVRASLAAAMADDVLSRREEDSILRQAKKLLAPDELPGLRQTLSRLSARRQASPASTPPKDEKRKDAEEGHTEQQGSKRTTQAGFIAPDKEEHAENLSYDEPAAEDDQQSPFEEESFQERREPMDDATVIFEDGFNTFNTFQSFYVDGLRHVSLFTTVDAFKGPLDLDNQNGNFGVNFAVNAGIPVARRLGIGIQGGTSAVLADFHGTQFTGAKIRAQNFTTVGLYHHVPIGCRNLKWGAAFDWLHDDYYTTFTMGQWRVKLGCELDPCNEIGIWACIPDDGDSARLGSERMGFTTEFFKPVPQGNLYYRRFWLSGTTTTGWLGIVEEPGEFVFGADARIPVSPRLAFVGNFNYVLPSASGGAGREEEMWNVSMGIELTLGCGANRCLAADKFAPLFPLANNGTFAIRRF